MTLAEICKADQALSGVDDVDLQWIIERLEANKIKPNNPGYHTMRRINDAQEMIMAAIDQSNYEALHCALRYLMDACDLTGKINDWHNLAKDCVEELKSRVTTV